jgi:hypothetical protein
VKRNPNYFLDRNGRNLARMVVPKNLRALLRGRTELGRPLGADRHEAMRKLHAAVVCLRNSSAASS